MAGIIGGLILEKGSIQDLAQGTAAMIVLGGTFGAVLVTTPMATCCARSADWARCSSNARATRRRPSMA